MQTKARIVFWAVAAMSLTASLCAGQSEHEEMARVHDDVAKVRAEIATLKDRIEVLMQQLQICEQKLAEIARKAKERSVERNMHRVQLNLEEFSTLAEWAYPATLAVTVGEVLTGLSYTVSEKPSSICGEDPGIPPYGPQAMVPSEMRNPFDPARTCIVTSKTDPPEWSPDLRGVVFYIPLRIKGKMALGYRIYGAGESGLLDIVLSSGF